MTIFRICFFLACAFVLQTLFGSDLSAQSITLNWNQDGNQCVYVVKRSQRLRTFYLVDVEKGTRQLAFDHQLIAKLLGEKLGQPINGDKLPISQIEFAKADVKTLKLAGPAGTWYLAIGNNQLTKVDPSHSTDNVFFMPPRASGPSDQRTGISISNRLDQDVEIFWVQTPRQLRSFGKIGKGKAKSISTYVGHVWMIKSIEGKPLACFDSGYDSQVEITKTGIDAAASNKNKSSSRRRRRMPNDRQQAWNVFVKDHDLWLKKNENDDTAEPILLAADGVKENSFSRNGQNSSTGPADAHWSPNGKYVVAIQRTSFEPRKVYFVESSPRGQLQPRLQEYVYPKPGDPVVIKSFRLFSTDDKKEISISNDLFKHPYSSRFLKWSDSGERFWIHYNQRGHQAIRLLEVSVPSGEVRTIAENTSDTFLEHTNRAKSLHRFLPENRLLWASERSGWNHLYLIDLENANVINPVTQGDWNVKRVEKVDEKNRQIWFYAVGVRPEQDPYHEHFCRVDFDGNNFKILTKGDGTHSVKPEQNNKFLIDTWSRVDLAPVVELREQETGELICELDRQQASESYSDRRLTQRFSAPGRDGKTLIWGILHFPKGFDPDKKYPVVENIYAGPHDQHVPKTFQKSFRTQHKIADAGMIVVQIDGMGTAWRSKEFHDVCFKNLRDAGFPDRIAWMKAAAEEFPQMDISRVGIYGGSAGGQNAMAALLWHNDFYSVAIADCGCHDNRMDKMWWNEQWMGFPIDKVYEENSNMENAHLLKGHLMLTVGEKDRNVDPASTTQVVNALIKANKDFEFVLIPGGGHGSGETPWAARKRLNFLKKHLQANDEP